MLRGEHVELRGVEIGELAVRGDERLLGRGVLRDGREQIPASRASARRTADATTGVDTGRRPAAASCGRAEQLREPVHGEEGDADDTAARVAHRAELARREPAPRRDPDRVRRHDDRHRRERVGCFRARDRVAQRLRRRHARTRSARR